MAGTLHSGLGAIRSDLPFPRNECRPSTQTHLANLLGQTWPIGNNAQVMLVVHKAAALSDADALAFEYTDSSAYTVQVTSATGDIACGVSHPSQEALTSGGYFFLIQPAGPGDFRFSITDSGSGMTKDDLCQSTAGGEGITDAAESDRATLGVVMETIAADAKGDILAFPDAFAGNNV